MNMEHQWDDTKENRITGTETHNPIRNLRVCCNQGRTRGGGGGGALPGYRPRKPPKNRNLKKTFYRMNDIRNFTLFSLQPKSAIEISGLVN
jgi:hypothetical protein